MKLISDQRPDATMVAGRSRWRQMGRDVNEDSSPITILVPTRNGDGTTTFENGHVFDISDTYGAAVPEPIAPMEGSGELADLVQAMERSAPVPVRYDPAAEVATYSPTEKASLTEGFKNVPEYTEAGELGVKDLQKLLNDSRTAANSICEQMELTLHPKQREHTEPER